MEQPSDLLTSGEAAKKLGVSDETVRKWIHKGLLPAITLPSGQFRVRQTTVDAILATGNPPAQLDDAPASAA